MERFLVSTAIMESSRIGGPGRPAEMKAVEMQRWLMETELIVLLLCYITTHAAEKKKKRLHTGLQSVTQTKHLEAQEPKKEDPLIFEVQVRLKS